MSKAEKIAGLAMLGGAVAEKLLLRRLLVGMVELLLFAIVVSVLSTALLITGLYVAYRLLLEHGLNTDTALLITSGIGAMLILALTAIALDRFRRLHRKLTIRPALVSKISHVAESFIDGLLTASPPHDKNDQRKSKKALLQRSVETEMATAGGGCESYET